MFQRFDDNQFHVGESERNIIGNRGQPLFFVGGSPGGHGRAHEDGRHALATKRDHVGGEALATLNNARLAREDIGKVRG